MIDLNGSDFSHERSEHAYKAYVKDISLTIKITTVQDNNWSWEVCMENVTDLGVVCYLPPNNPSKDLPAITTIEAYETKHSKWGESPSQQITYQGQCWYHLMNKSGKTYFPDDIVRFLCHGWETF